MADGEVTVRPTGGDRPTSEGDARNVVGDPDTVVSAITHDSTRVLPGTLFCCVVGERFDGHDFASAAVDAGAIALLVERQLPLDVAQIVVPERPGRHGPGLVGILGPTRRTSSTSSA